jgi:flagellar motor protein MotB
MEDERTYNFNFWPAFADLMLSFILMLLLVIGGTYFSSINIRTVQEEQKKIGETLQTPGRAIRVFERRVEIRDSADRVLYVLTVDPNDPMLQTISFSDALLFNPDEYELKPGGKEALREVGGVLASRLADLAEIQIRGHADNHSTRKHTDNLELASLRANAVFRFLTDEVRIDPSKNLMSATSFGEFSPVQRKRDAPFDQEALENANADDTLRQANRRIELVLFFRRPKALKVADIGSKTETKH